MLADVQARFGLARPFHRVGKACDLVALLGDGPLEVRNLTQQLHHKPLQFGIR